MALQVGGSLLSAVGQEQQGQSRLQYGNEAYQAALFQAQQLRQNAGQAIAASQRSASDIQRQTDYVTSRALAVAAAGGGGAQDPTVINLIARTAGEGAYRQSLALYQGQEKSREMNEQAQATEYSGAMQLQNAQGVARASNLGVATTLMRGGASLYSKYGGGGPNLSDVNADAGISDMSGFA